VKAPTKRVAWNSLIKTLFNAFATMPAIVDEFTEARLIRSG
jgi:hypothetical protein